MRDIVVIAFCIAFLAAATLSPINAAITYWWFGIFRPHEWAFTHLISDYRLPLIAALIFIGSTFLRGYYPNIKDSLAKLMIAWLVIASLAYFLSGCIPITAKANHLMNISILIFIVLLTTRVIEEKKHFFYVAAIVGISLGFHAGKAGFFGLTGTGGTYYSASTMGGLFKGSNGFAFGSAVLLFFNLYIAKLAYTNQLPQLLPHKFNSTIIIKIVKIVMPIIIVGIAYNVITLFSRGSFLGMAIGIFIWLFLNGISIKSLFIVIFVSTLTVTFVDLPEGYTERIESAFADEGELEASAASRPYFWGIAIDIVNDYPIGVGPGCYNSFYDSYDTTNGAFGHARTVHGSHFEILSETGYPGIILWFSMIFISLKRLIKIRRKGQFNDDIDERFFYDSANMLIAAQIVFMAGGTFYAQAYNDIIWLIWGLTIALTHIYNKKISTIGDV